MEMAEQHLDGQEEQVVARLQVEDLVRHQTRTLWVVEQVVSVGERPRTHMQWLLLVDEHLRLHSAGAAEVVRHQDGPEQDLVGKHLRMVLEEMEARPLVGRVLVQEVEEHLLGLVLDLVPGPERAQELEVEEHPLGPEQVDARQTLMLDLRTPLQVDNYKSRLVPLHHKVNLYRLVLPTLMLLLLLMAHLHRMLLLHHTELLLLMALLPHTVVLLRRRSLPLRLVQVISLPHPLATPTALRLHMALTQLPHLMETSLPALPHLQAMFHGIGQWTSGIS
jgi:hypothetical protein